jgi:hypothetical protein
VWLVNARDVKHLPGRGKSGKADCAMYRRIARKRGKQKAIVAVSRVICEIAWILICDPSTRYQELGPGKKVILADAAA